MRIIRITLILFFVLIIVLTLGCEGLSSAPTPPDSQYSADIIGQVVMTENVQNWFMDEPGSLKLKEGYIFWVTNIAVKNKTYSLSALREIQGYRSGEPNWGYKSVWGYWDWGIEVDGKIYNPPEAFKVFSKSTLTIAEGETAKLLNCFEVPKNLSIDKAKLLYRGQQPYSYGNLIGGDTVAVYDWKLKKVTQVSVSQTKVSQKKVATVERIWVSAIWVGGGSLYVELKPTSNAIANKIYTVELYEKGKLRATAKVSWNQPEINVSTMKPVKFSATRQEAEAYGMERDLSNIFSVKVHE